MATTTDKELQELKDEFATLKSELSEIGDTVSRLARSATDEGRADIDISLGDSLKDVKSVTVTELVTGKSATVEL